MLQIIVAMDRHRVIGRGGALPWRLPADLRRFKALTLGHPVIMGRKTWQSIGRPLAGRTNIVVSRQEGFRARGATVVQDLDEAIRVAGGDAFVIGGGEIYRQALERADVLHVTQIDAAVEGGDTWFPEIDPRQWEETAREAHGADAENPLGYTFQTYRRRAPDPPP